ncbi:MAG: hypothetical protein PF481_03030 [Bacteroidales bacterium]|jgi:hypothetical protein|nr:hypothetical protein [Bacteroidales bacterium]
MTKLFNNLWSGIALGTLIPVLSFLGIYIWFTNTLTLQEYLSKLTYSNVATNVYIWSMIPTFILASVLYYKKWDYGLKGLIIPTFFYIFAIVIINF